MRKVKVSKHYIFGRWLGDGFKTSTMLYIARDNSVIEKNNMELIAKSLNVSFRHEDKTNSTIFHKCGELVKEFHMMYSSIVLDEYRFTEKQILQIMAGFIDSDGGVEHQGINDSGVLGPHAINIVLYNNDTALLMFFKKFVDKHHISNRLEEPTYNMSLGMPDSCYRLHIYGSMDTYLLGYWLSPFLIHDTKKGRIDKWIAMVDQEYQKKSLPIAEIFKSLEGEGRLSGTPMVFVRVKGCPFKCSFCDSAFSQGCKDNNNYAVPISEIIDIVHKLIKKSRRQPNIEFTGGSPDWYPTKVGYLLVYFKTRYFAHITMQVSGGLFSDKIHKLFRLSDLNAFDCKDPREKIPFKIPYKYIREQDEIKFLISDEFSYKFAKNTIYKMYKQGVRCAFILIPKMDINIKDKDLLRQSHLYEYEKLVNKFVDDFPFNNISTIRVLPRLHILVWGAKQGV